MLASFKKNRNNFTAKPLLIFLSFSIFIPLPGLTLTKQDKQKYQTAPIQKIQRTEHKLPEIPDRFKKSLHKKLKKLRGKRSGHYLILISKKERTLYLVKAQVSASKFYSFISLQKFNIAIGENPDLKAKLYDGDRRTPEGLYQIRIILSSDAPRNSFSFRELQRINAKYYSKKNGYRSMAFPGQDLGRNVFGPRYFEINYPNNEDLSRYRKALRKGLIPKENNRTYRKIGTNIAIHGSKETEIPGHLAGPGCVQMHNRDIIKLDPFIEKRSLVIILP